MKSFNTILVVLALSILIILPKTSVGQSTADAPAPQRERNFGLHMGWLAPYSAVKLGLDFKINDKFELFQELILVSYYPGVFFGGRYLAQPINNSRWQPYFGLGFGGLENTLAFQSQAGVRFATGNGFELRLGLTGIHTDSTPPFVYHDEINIASLEIGIGWRF